MLRKIQRWVAIDGRDRVALVAAVARLLRSRVEFQYRSTKAILDDLAAPRRAGASSSVVGDPDAPRRIGWAVTAAARYVPWRADCLIQAMAASAWLRDLGYAPHFELGLLPASREGAELVAHAWLSLDGEVIVGGEDAGARYVSIMRGARDGEKSG